MEGGRERDWVAAANEVGVATMPTCRHSPLDESQSLAVLSPLAERILDPWGLKVTYNREVRGHLTVGCYDNTYLRYFTGVSSQLEQAAAGANIVHIGRCWKEEEEEEEEGARGLIKHVLFSIAPYSSPSTDAVTSFCPVQSKAMSNTSSSWPLEPGGGGGGRGGSDTKSHQSLTQKGECSGCTLTCPPPPPPRGYLSVSMSLPERASQSLQVWSMEAEATTRPSKLNRALEISAR